MFVSESSEKKELKTNAHEDPFTRLMMRNLLQITLKIIEEGRKKAGGGLELLRCYLGNGLEVEPDLFKAAEYYEKLLL